jgi:hypothetical protein
MVFQTITNFDYDAFAFRDTWKTIAIAIAFGLALYLTLSWIATNVVGQTEIIFVYFSLLLLFVVGYAANLAKKNIPKLQPLPFGTVAIGWNIKAIAVLSLLGLGLSYFLISQQVSVALPLEVTYKQAVVTMDYVYKVIMSPIIEEMFRAVVLLTSALIVWKFTKNWMLALLAGLLISAFSFGVFHWLAYQQSFAFIGAAIIFGIIAGILMIASKSIVPAIAFHYANNQLVFAEGDPTTIIIAGGLITAFLIVAMIRRWG